VREGVALPAGAPVALPGLTGDAIEVNVSFAPGNATTVGLRLRALPGGFSCDVSWDVAAATLSAGGTRGWPAGIVPQPAGRVDMRLFLDRCATHSIA
jgi:hypothetical protein